MPGEANKFDEVDKMWRKLMSNINENKLIRIFTENRSFLDDLNLCFEYIEKVNRGLNGYIEGKQVLFPRFFFLSKDDLLDILKQTKDPTRVQPHLKKCFEGIQTLKFDDNKKIHGMGSSKKEFVKFLKPIVAG